MTRLRIGFLSGVRHARQYVDVLAADPRVEIVEVAEEPGVPQWMLDEGRAVADQAGARWSTDPATLLDRAVVDLVVVCSEPTRHAALAIRALEAGVHVLVDKPVSTTLADADLVVAAAERAAGTCSVVNRTHAPALRRARGWVDAGHLGLPSHLDVEFLASGAHFATSVERPELVVDPALSGGGELLNFLGYCVDAVRYLTGLEVEDVYAMAGALFGAGHREHGVEDTSVVSLGLQRGVTATVTLGRVPFAPGTGPTTSSIRILGSHGHAVADDDHPAVVRYSDAGAVTDLDAGRVALDAFLGHVVGRLLDGRAPDYSVADARASMAVIDAAYRAVATRGVAVVHPPTTPRSS
ncbi:gfo/Idh/MocA family oxidoreductase [Cellulomonas sp. WB94]|uniref:Gfo/Idh/MocA family protein n=1 Tax=Cellulomonas sp. WB94 TaxID=2173174 RepID=UPI000D57F491|nr:Gfo/Idh/MocA family oxidoreductase [Cellulomonas sp. WB94]PVU82863.1 gfo/Idh/MocA family oxidoreductase [Cellulomonas sp. WB94]